MRQNYSIPNLIFRENFVSEQRVLDNGLEIVGSPTIDNGLSNCSVADYISNLPYIHPVPTGRSYFIDLTVPASIAGSSYDSFIDSQSGDQRPIYFYEGFGIVYNKTVISSGNVYLAIINPISAYYGQRISIGAVVYESGGNVIRTPVVNGVFGSPNSSPGTIILQPENYVIGLNSDNFTFHRAYVFDSILTELDFAKLHAGVWS